MAVDEHDTPLSLYNQFVSTNVSIGHEPFVNMCASKSPSQSQDRPSETKICHRKMVVILATLESSPAMLCTAKSSSLVKKSIRLQGITARESTDAPKMTSELNVDS